MMMMMTQAGRMSVTVAVLMLANVGNVFGIGESVMDVNTFAGIIGGIGNMLQNNVQTLDIDRDMIMGRWFQMYKAAINFDVFRTQMFCPVAYFKPNSVMGEDGFSIEEAYRVVSKGGPIETYKRDVNKVGKGQFWMYTEEYFYPRQFYIIGMGPDYGNTTSTKLNATYEYLIVTDANRLALMVFARDPLTFFQDYNKQVMEFLQKSGFGGSVFWNNPQALYQGPDCQWPSEKEVFARRVLKNQETVARAKERDSRTPASASDILPDGNGIGMQLQQLVRGGGR